MPGVPITGWRPGDLGQASEHLSPAYPYAGRANAKGWAGAAGWGGQGGGGAEVRPLTAPYVRLNATTSFAWFWCGCCASRKASFTESRFFSAAMATRWQTRTTSQRASQARLPPEFWNPSRERARLRGIFARGGTRKPKDTRLSDPSPTPIWTAAAGHACAEGVARCEDSVWAWPEVLSSSRSRADADVQLSARSWWHRCSLLRRWENRENLPRWERGLQSCCLTRETERRGHMRDSGRARSGVGEARGSWGRSGLGLLQFRGCSGRAAALQFGGPGRERRNKCSLQPLGGAPASRVCFTPLRNNSSRRRRTQTVQKYFGVLAKTRTGYYIKLSPMEWLSWDLGRTPPKWETYLASCLVIVQNCSLLSRVHWWSVSGRGLP